MTDYTSRAEFDELIARVERLEAFLGIIPDGGGSLDDLDDIVGQVTELADKMLSSQRDQNGFPSLDHDPLKVERWAGAADECLICGDEFNTGDEYVTLPEDTEYNEPEGPAHVGCADSEGWEIALLP